MLEDIPCPEAYDVSATTGFLPGPAPPDPLPEPYYAQWTCVARSLPSLLGRGCLRETIERMSVLPCDRLATLSQLRAAYSTLAFLAHAYIWSDDRPAKVVPPPISIPFLTVCERLDMPPVATYAGVVLWNFMPVSSSVPFDRLDNLTTLTTFTGTLDESWFYLVSVAIEAHGGPLISRTLDTMQAVRKRDTLLVREQLRQLSTGLDAIPTLLTRLYEDCDPSVFYHNIRRYLAGTKAASVEGLPEGVAYDDGSGSQQPVAFAGGSNAQSSLIQFFDVALGIAHGVAAHSSGSACSSAGPPGGSTTDQSEFLKDMQQYMPRPHRQFLSHVGRVANIRDYVAEQRDETLSATYDACVTALIHLRNLHLQIVSRYIVRFARNVQGPAHNTESPSSNPALPASHRLDGGHAADQTINRSNEAGLTGTGGTAAVPLLKHIRDETRASLVV